MADAEADALRILDELGLSSSEDESTDDALRILDELGLGESKAPAEHDFFQPIRTAFGATQTALPTLLLGETDAYKRAHEAAKLARGVTPTTPWYESIEARPGLGDVLAETVPDSIRNSLVGTALGPVSRLVGNIAGDPTSYLGEGLKLGAEGIARGVEGVPAMMEGGGGVIKALRAMEAPAEVINAARTSQANRIAQQVLEKGSGFQKAAVPALQWASKAGPTGLGVGAAAAYLPETAKGAYEAWTERLPAAEGVKENVAEGANAILLTGLSLLMGHGVIDAGKAIRTAHNLAAEQSRLPGEIAAAEEGVLKQAEAAPLQEPDVAPPVEGVGTEPSSLPPEGPAAPVAPAAGPDVTQPVRVLSPDLTQPVEVVRPIPPIESAPGELKPERPLSGYPKAIAEAKAETDLGHLESMKRAYEEPVALHASKEHIASRRKVLQAIDDRIAELKAKPPESPAVEAAPAPQQVLESAPPESPPAVAERPTSPTPEPAPEQRPGPSEPAPAAGESPLEAQLRASIEAEKAKKAAAAGVQTPELAPSPEVVPAREAPTPAPAAAEGQPTAVELAPAREPDTAVAPVGPRESRKAMVEALNRTDDALKKSPEMQEVVKKANKDAHSLITETLLDPEKRAALAADIKGKSPREILGLIRRRAAAKKVVEEKGPAPDAFARTKQALAADKQNIHTFAKSLEPFEFQGPGKMPDGSPRMYKFEGPIKDAYLKYLELRDKGMSRPDAIKAAAKLKPQFQNFLAGIEREAEKTVVARFGAEEDQAAMAAAEGRAPLVTAEQLKAIKGELDARFPALKLPEESVEGFTERMKTPEVITLLSDYHRYLQVRGTVKGAHRAGDARVIQLAKDLGISYVGKRPNVLREVIPAILNKLGVELEARQALRDQGEAAVAAAQRKAMQPAKFQPTPDFTSNKPGVWRSKNGTEIHVAGEKNFTATLADFTDAAGLQKDLEELAKHPELGKIAVPDFEPKPNALKGRGPKAAQALEAAGFVVEPDKPADAIPTYIKPKKVAGMGPRMTTQEVLAALKAQESLNPGQKALIKLIEEATEAERFPDPAAVPDAAFWDSYTPSNRALPEPWGLLTIPEVIELTHIPPFRLISAAAVKGAIDASFRARLVQRLVAKGITGFGTKDSAFYGKIGTGTYHGIWQLKGARDQHGNRVVMRLGFAPHIPLTGKQEALMMPILDYGVMPTELGPLHYTIHRQGISPELMMSASVDDTGALTSAMIRVGIPKPGRGFDAALYKEAELASAGRLPPGVSFDDYRADSHELLTKLIEQRLGAVDADTHTSKLRTPEGKLRGDQLLYTPLAPGEHPDGAVIRTGEGGRRWALTVSDRGAYVPVDKIGPWAHMSRRLQVALQRHSPDKDLTPAEQRLRYAEYAQDAKEGVKIGKKLVVANHDQLASDDFLVSSAQLTQGPAHAIARILEDIVPALNRALGYEGTPVDIELGGLTVSPLMSGLHVAEKGERGKIFINLVDALRVGKDYEGAIDEAIHTLIHEVTHDRMVLHDQNFHTFEGYVKAVASLEGKVEQYRAALREAMPKELYNQMQETLMPEYEQMRRNYVERVSAGAAEGRAPAVPGGRAGDQAAVPPDLAGGVQPGGAVPGGAPVETGQLRAAAAASDIAPEGSATGEAAGRGGGGGAVEADQAAYDHLVTRVAKAFPGGKSVDFEEAKKLLHELANENQKMGRPPRETLTAAWDMSGRVMSLYTPDEIKEMASSLPYPRQKNQVEGAINQLHYLDLPDTFKARMKLWYDLTPKDWDRNTVEHWADVEKQVQDFIGLDTPEGWARTFQGKKGGLTSGEVLLLRQVHNELSNKQIEAEQRFADAVAFGNNAQIELTERLLTRANENFIIGAHTLATKLTGQARGLAIARHNVRSMNPILRFQQDMLAAVRERVNTRYKDPAKAQQVAQDLMGALLHVIKDPNPSNEKLVEWWNLWRATMNPSTTEKALEWYKAGLLGWPSRVANLTSNTLFRGVRYLEDGIAAGLDAARHQLTGAKRELYVGELGVSALAFQRAMKEGGRDWMAAFKRNIFLQPDDAAALFTKGALAEDLLQGGGAISGKFGEFVRFQLKGLGHDDALAKHLARTDYVYREIYRRFRKGSYQLKTGESITTGVERMFTELRDNFDNARAGKKYSADLLRHWELIAGDAEQHAKVETFQEDLGDLGRGAQAFLRQNPFFQVFFPFIRTPTNIAKETIKRTPLGFINVARKWKGLTEAQKLTELAKPTVGTMFGGLVLMEAMMGNISGAGPIDPDELETLKSTGWQPHSIKVGNQWVSYSRFEPIAAVAGIAADAAEGIRDGDFDRWQTGAIRVMQAAAANITDKTFLAGMDNLLSAASHPEQYGKRFVKNLQGSMIPNSIGYVPISGLARALDPVYRTAEPLTMDAFYTKIPWASTTLEPQYGPTGEVRRRPGSPIEQVISPFARTERKEGPGVVGAEEVVRVSAAPRGVKPYWLGPGGVKVNFTHDERIKLAKALQQATEVVGRNLINDPSYNRLPDDEEDPNYRFGGRTKKDVIQKIYARYREQAMNQMRASLMSRARKAVQVRAAEAQE